MVNFKFSIRNPDESDAVIISKYDYWIRKLILRDVKALTIGIYNDPQIIYLTPSILFSTLKNFYFLSNSNKKSLKDFLKSLYFSYVLTCIKKTKAKVVLTWIDNSYLFHFLAKHDTERKYIAIQNGGRHIGCVKYEIPNAYKIYHQNFYCFGQRVVDLYNKFGHKVENFFPYGSVIGGYFFEKNPRRPNKFLYDICLISQKLPRTSNKTSQYKKTIKSTDVAYKMFADISKKLGLRVCVCLRSNKDSEVSYFNNLFNGSAEIISYDMKKLSSYYSGIKSKLIVGLNSTLLEEFFGYGYKVLFFNPLKYDVFNSKDAGFCYIESENYSALENRIKRLLEMDYKSFSKLTDKNRKFICNYTNIPSYRRISFLVNDLVGDKIG